MDRFMDQNTHADQATTRWSHLRLNRTGESVTMKEIDETPSRILRRGKIAEMEVLEKSGLEWAVQ